MKKPKDILPKTIYGICLALKKIACPTLIICKCFHIFLSLSLFLIPQMCRFKCKRCVNNVQVKLPPENSDCTSDLSQWYHCTNNRGLPDTILSQAWDVAKSVSFVFHHRSNSTAAEAEAATAKLSQGKQKQKYIDEDDFEEEPDDDYNDEDFVG